MSEAIIETTPPVVTPKPTPSGTRTESTDVPNAMPIVSTPSEWVRGSQGMDAVNYQRSTQMTFWSILQGLAVLALADKIPPILAQLTENNKWYLLLYVIVTAMILVVMWVSYAWSILIYRRRIELFGTALIFLAGLAGFLLSWYVDTPVYWLRAGAFSSLTGMITNAYNLYSKDITDLPREKVIQTISAYGIFFLIQIGGSLHIALNPNPNTEIFWVFVAFVGTSLAWLLQAKNMKQERAQRNIP